MSDPQRRYPPPPPGTYLGPKEQVYGPHGSRSCPYCDEYGWVIDPDDRYGWAIRCRHDPHQLRPVKPDSVTEAARMIREGRRREEAEPGYYQRGPDPSEPRRGRP
ncbi:hypothetical protein NDR87_30090 [Nocardia sp. CDC159]|uniref:Uncharacterized protein n=1 Tax=Nocardia pulmonis TaxID=2951408 RepID=A0A9X2IZT1_9NOCA|nr:MULTISPECIES: hypothetical protein [Nocardia]MCM6777743.1 hypothetical protein [Nocardia pulmonis]MCM6790628.1 hypothetical protein [Nocardia sp. CDC159]